MDRVHLFLAELTDLTLKYGLQIAGCGCCDSPAVYKTDAEGGEYKFHGGQDKECGRYLEFVERK